MRRLAIALASQVLFVAAISTDASAGSKPGAAVLINRAGVTLSGTAVEMRLRGSQAAGLREAELDVDLDAGRARLFRNATLARQFTGSSIRVGRSANSPYLRDLGVGDGITARLEAGGYAVTAAGLSGIAGRSAAAELSALDGAISLQAGHRAAGHDKGAMTFTGGHVDFDVLNAEFSLRWHVGRDEIADGVRETSAGGAAFGVSSLIEDGDRLRAAMSRPLRPGFGLASPDLQMVYLTPLTVGRMACIGGVRTADQASTVKVSWSLRW